MNVIKKFYTPNVTDVCTVKTNYDKICCLSSYLWVNFSIIGRLKQTSALEEQNLAQKDQLRLQEIEIQQLVQALSDARRGNVEARNDFVDKESVMTNRLQILSKV